MVFLKVVGGSAAAPHHLETSFPPSPPKESLPLSSRWAERGVKGGEADPEKAPPRLQTEDIDAAHLD